MSYNHFQIFFLLFLYRHQSIKAAVLISYFLHEIVSFFLCACALNKLCSNRISVENTLPANFLFSLVTF